MQTGVKSVDLLTMEIKGLLEGSLRNLWVEGELSGFRISNPSGHAYFTLKGTKTIINCVMFRSDLVRIPIMPRDGDNVLLNGDVKVYEPQGKYQIYARGMRLSGQGDLHRQFEELKAKLLQEGLFAPDKKRPLPLLPTCIGVVTSISGAALRDIVKVAWQRYPGISLVIAPALVQGNDAPKSLQMALRSLLLYKQKVDVVIIGRGGGAIEDLSAFNDEALVREIAAFPSPVISAVGHETDFTLCDFVADVRAATPSAAAQLAIPERLNLSLQIDNILSRMKKNTLNSLSTSSSDLKNLSYRLKLASPGNTWQSNSQQVDETLTRMERAIIMLLNREKTRTENTLRQMALLSPLEEVKRFSQKVEGIKKTLDAAVGQQLYNFRDKIKQKSLMLENLNPLEVLKRGYAICYLDNPGQGRKLMSSVNPLGPAMKTSIILADGEFKSTILEVKHIEREKAGK